MECNRYERSVFPSHLKTSVRLPCFVCMFVSKSSCRFFLFVSFLLQSFYYYYCYCHCYCYCFCFISGWLLFGNVISFYVLLLFLLLSLLSFFSRYHWLCLYKQRTSRVIVLDFLSLSPSLSNTHTHTRSLSLLYGWMREYIQSI